MLIRSSGVPHVLPTIASAAAADGETEEGLVAAAFLLLLQVPLLPLLPRPLLPSVPPQKMSPVSFPLSRRI
jgi:hypothetical protein